MLNDTFSVIFKHNDKMKLKTKHRFLKILTDFQSCWSRAQGDGVNMMMIIVVLKQLPTTKQARQLLSF